MKKSYYMYIQFH